MVQCIFIELQIRAARLASSQIEITRLYFWRVFFQCLYSLQLGPIQHSNFYVIRGTWLAWPLPYFWFHLF